MKGNEYRKLYPMDKFAKKYYCAKAKRNAIRDDKKRLRKLVRENGKEEIRNGR